jgi:hypothetical protein
MFVNSLRSERRTPVRQVVKNRFRQADLEIGVPAAGIKPETRVQGELNFPAGEVFACIISQTGG